jgi:hypothetical protein
VAIEPARRAARLTGFEDSNSSTNVGIDSKAAGQGTVLSNIDENLTLLDNAGNGDSVPATVPGSELSVDVLADEPETSSSSVVMGLVAHPGA